jgi:hypothetical protein
MTRSFRARLIGPHQGPWRSLGSMADEALPTQPGAGWPVGLAAVEVVKAGAASSRRSRRRPSCRRPTRQRKACKTRPCVLSASRNIDQARLLPHLRRKTFVFVSPHAGINHVQTFNGPGIPAGEAAELHGIPVIAPGVSGAIAGTRPDRAAVRPRVGVRSRSLSRKPSSSAAGRAQARAARSTLDHRCHDTGNTARSENAYLPSTPTATSAASRSPIRPTRPSSTTSARVLGGTSKPSNLLPAHRSCNGKKARRGAKARGAGSAPLARER